MPVEFCWDVDVATKLSSFSDFITTFALSSSQFCFPGSEEVSEADLYIEQISAGMYLDNLTFGNGRCPPTSAITSTTTVCFLAVSMFTTPADRPQTAHSD